MSMPGIGFLPGPVSAEYGVSRVLERISEEHEKTLRLLAEAARRPESVWPTVWLVPDYVESLPEDPFSQQPFRYRRTRERYEIHSVGPNLVDDLGRADWDPRRKRRDSEQPDWVWRYEAVEPGEVNDPRREEALMRIRLERERGAALGKEAWKARQTEERIRKEISDERKREIIRRERKRLRQERGRK